VDNSGASVRQVELLLDDNPIGRACGAALSAAGRPRRPARGGAHPRRGGHQRRRKARWRVAGQLQTHEARGAANTELELVDRQGNVVARTVTTEQGNYRFRNVDSGNYQVRASRRGFRAVSQAVEARAGAPAAAARPMQMQLH
jgi:hypothetical protein